MKKTVKRAEQGKPQSVQLDAIRRLVQNEHFQEARTRLAALRQRFPNFRPLLALAWEIEDEAGNEWGAAARAFEWAHASPSSVAALSALVESAFAIGLIALGADAAAKLAALTGTAIEPFPTAVETPFGPMSVEEMMLADLARLLLTDHRYDEVLLRLQDATHASLCNNRALAHFAAGNVAQALEDLERNWQSHPHNLFAIERIIRLRLWLRGRDCAAGLTAPLQASEPRRAEDALGKINGLLLLGEWHAADASWQSDSTADYWSDQQEHLRGMFDYAGAVSALHTGNMAAAMERLRLARKANPGDEAIIDLELSLLSASETGGYIVEVGEPAAWFPLSWYNRLASFRGARQPNIEAQARQHLAICDAHAEYLVLAVELGGRTAGAIAEQILKQRATQGDQAAKDQLISLLTRPCGPDSHRADLLSWLSEEKLIKTGVPIPILANGQITQIKPLSFSLTPEPTYRNPYAHAIQKRYEAMTELLHHNRVDEALAEASEIRRLAPEVPMSHANLALIKEAMDDRDKEIEPLFRQALELDDNYIFARAGLARVLARRGDVEAAATMLVPVFSREEYHFSEWKTILLAQREMALAERNSNLLKAIDKSLRELEEMKRQ